MGPAGTGPAEDARAEDARAEDARAEAARAEAARADAARAGTGRAGSRGANVPRPPRGRSAFSRRADEISGSHARVRPGSAVPHAHGKRIRWRDAGRVPHSGPR
ncbi:hypothetical protein ACFVRU_49695, partial [Streptomyces sp. NPDC057927]